MRGPIGDGLNQKKHNQLHFYPSQYLQRIPLFMSDVSNDDVSQGIKTYDCKLDEKQVCERISIFLVFKHDYLLCDNNTLCFVFMY